MPFEQLVDDSFEIQIFQKLSVAIVVKSDMTDMLLDTETKGLFGQILTL